MIATTNATGSLIAGFITLSPSAAGLNVGGNRYVLDTCLTRLVHDFCNDTRRSEFIGDDHDRVIRPLDVQPFDGLSQLAQLQLAAVHPDLPVRSNADQKVPGL